MSRCIAGGCASAFAAGNGNSKVQLNQNWALQSSAKITQGGDVLSTTNFHPEGWYDVTVPTTVVAALVKHNVYPDPYYGMNMRSIPGTVYPIGSNLPFTARICQSLSSV